MTNALDCAEPGIIYITGNITKSAQFSGIFMEKLVFTVLFKDR